MEPASQLAPPVVAVMVVSDPGDWFDEVLDGLADQDYPNLKSLFLVVGEPGDTAERVRQRVPNAFVRGVGKSTGYGAAANEVLRLVQGENGFFCFLHDDVALWIRRRSAAGRGDVPIERRDRRAQVGLVGRPAACCSTSGSVSIGSARSTRSSRRARSTRSSTTRCATSSPCPSACLMVRADLFRAINGFDTAIDFYGDDVDLCWRAHLGGARVVVVPAARARHREALSERRPDLRPALLHARHRMRSVATLTGARRLPLLALQLFFATLVELVVGLFSGKPREAWGSVRAMFGLIPRLPGIIVRRHEVAPSASFPTERSPGCSCAALPVCRRTCAAATCARREARTRSSGGGARPPARRRCSPGSA